MVDITKCSGINCPIKSSCHRYTAPSDPLWQSMLLTPPFTINNGTFNCSMFWGVQQTSILDELKNIMGTKKQHK